jgi:eukaryotic-like serine/threonine-protein kinase
MGSVWLADRADGRYEGHVAIKFLRADLFGSGSGSRFAREGQILGRLSHPHIARLLDAGLRDGVQPYLVLEYVEGQPIDRYCQQHGLDTAARVRLFLDVLAAVAHAQSRLILHRDLKPGNVLVTAAGEVKLLDFGIAKLLDDASQGVDGAGATAVTQVAGSAYTPQFAAPEQVQLADVTTATDVYALGVMLYLLLSGRHPTALDTQTRLDHLKAVVEVEPRRLSSAAAASADPAIARQARLLKGDLDTIVAKALKKKPADRYANAQALADDLRRWLAHEPIGARPDSRLYVLGRFVRRHRLAVAMGSLAVLALAGLTAESLRQARRAEAAQLQAESRQRQAEDVLSFMLGEFADKLRPIGRLELLDSVGGKALKVLDHEGPLSPAGRLQRAKALTVIGEVRVSKRELEAAIEPLTAANALLQGDPPQADMVAAWRKAQGAAAFWLGHVHYRQRQLAPAEQAWGRYRQVSELWLKGAPQDLDAQVESSYAENSWGTLLLSRGQLPLAEQAFRRSLALKEAVLAKRLDDASLHNDWADTVSWLGTTLRHAGRHRSAMALYEMALGRVEELRWRYPNDLSWLASEVNLAFYLGVIRRELGADGRPPLNRARAGVQQLTASDAKNRAWAFLAINVESEWQALQPGDARSRSRGAMALLSRVDALGAGKKTPDNWLIRQVNLLKQAMEAPCSPNDCQAIDRTLDQLAQRVTTAVQRDPDDLQMLNAAVQLRLLRAQRAAPDAAAARLHCWMQVHAELTQRWMQVQACLDPQASRQAGWRSATDWLTQQREL